VWALPGSNRRPAGCKPAALPTELNALVSRRETDARVSPRRRPPEDLHRGNRTLPALRRAAQTGAHPGQLLAIPTIGAAKGTAASEPSDVASPYGKSEPFDPTIQYPCPLGVPLMPTTGVELTSP
jgi:hypothetical protein